MIVSAPIAWKTPSTTMNTFAVFSPLHEVPGAQPGRWVRSIHGPAIGTNSVRSALRPLVAPTTTAGRYESAKMPTPLPTMAMLGPVA